MNGDNSGGAGFGFYTSGGGSYLLAIQPFFNGSGCDVIHNFEDVSSGVKTEGFRLNSSGRAFYFLVSGSAFSGSF